MTRTELAHCPGFEGPRDEFAPWPMLPGISAGNLNGRRQARRGPVSPHDSLLSASANGAVIDGAKG